MTEYWKSNPMHWCELCRCWMNDTKAAKLNHERGTKHQENLARKLRDMSRKADTEKSQQERAAAAMDSIEKAAREAFAKDQAEAEAQAGKWMWTPSTGYYYNPTHRWYFDYKTSWYYGGDPVAWTQDPPLPSAAMFGAAPHEGGPAPEYKPPAAAAAAAAGGAGGAGSSSRAAAAAAAAAAAGAGSVKVVKKVVALPAHPQAAIGGHQMPVAGRIGGAKGVGAAQPAAGEQHKRKREEAAGGRPGSKKPLDPAEAQALARREAARQRVEQRTKQAFGLT